MQTWHIGLSSWIIQDGNYDDFKVGQQAEFALEFSSSKDFDITYNHQPSTIHLGDCYYKISAEVIYVEDNAWFIDFGLRAYKPYAPPSGLQVGMYITGDIWVGIDYYPYFEFLSKQDEVPALIYTWNIKQIKQQTAPLIEQNYTGPGFLSGKKVLARDPSKHGYANIESTNAWKDDHGHAEYILISEQLDMPPKRTSVTAT